MKARKIRTIRGSAFYYTLDNKIKLSNVFDSSQDFDVSFEVNREIISQSKVKKFVLELTQECSLRCSYCCYSGDYQGMRKHNPLKMTATNINYTIKFICSHYNHELDEIHVCFYGGEALLCFDEIKYIVNELTEKLGDIIHFSISTNGFLLASNIIDWICSVKNMQVVVSIDGDKEMHDTNRKQSNGKGSYNRIISNLSYFREKYPKEYYERMVILSTVADIHEIERLNDVWNTTTLGDIIPKVSTVNPNLNDPDVKLLNIKEADAFYKKAFLHYIHGEDNIMVRCLQTLIRPVEERDFDLYTEVMPVSTCLNEMKICFIDAKGNLYACEKVCNNQVIGNVKQGFDMQKIENLNARYVKRMNDQCRECWAMRLCPKCLINLNYKDNEMRILCEIERERIALALKYYCLIKDWQAYQKKKNNTKHEHI